MAQRHALGMLKLWHFLTIGSPLQCSAKAMLVLGEQMHIKSFQPWREARREELGFHPEHRAEQMGKLNSKQICCLAASGWTAAPAQLCPVKVKIVSDV